MADARARGWGAPCQVPKVTLVRADGLRLPTHRAIHDLVAILMDLTEMMGYDIPSYGTWGGLCRHIRNDPDLPWSNHAWWLAVDIDAPNNPMASAAWHRRNARGTRPFGLAIVCNIPEAVIQLWIDHGFGWGGFYRSSPDPMHMEFMGTPADAVRHTQRIRAYLAAHGNPAPDVPDDTQEDDMLLVNITSGPDEGRWFVWAPPFRFEPSSEESLVGFQATLRTVPLPGESWADISPSRTALDIDGLRDLPGSEARPRRQQLDRIEDEARTAREQSAEIISHVSEIARRVKD